MRHMSICTLRTVTPNGSLAYSRSEDRRELIPASAVPDVEPTTLIVRWVAPAKWLALNICTTPWVVPSAAV